MIKFMKDIKAGQVIMIDWHGKKVQVMVMNVSETEVVVR